MDDFPGCEFYDYYESVTLICRYPGCNWSGEVDYGEKMHEPFVDHFKANHGEAASEPQN